MNTNEPDRPKSSDTPRHVEMDYTTRFIVGPCEELAITRLDDRNPGLSAFLNRHWLTKHLRDRSDPC